MCFFALFCAWLAWNVHHPHKSRPEFLSVLSFMFGMPAGEMALQTIMLEAIIVLLVVWGGELSGGWDMIWLGVIFSSWLALVLFWWKAHNTDNEMEVGLRDALGAGYRSEIDPERLKVLDGPVDYNTLKNPFAFKKPGVNVVKNVQYGYEAGQKLKLDIYHHRDTPPNAPVLFQIHGGAWTEKFGDKNQQALPLMYQLASQGWVCVSVDYRLSPTHTFPAHIIDCKSALVWTKQNIADYGGDPDFIIATGGSAGGHLSALLAFSANDPEYQPDFPDVDTQVQGLVSIYGIHDFTNSENQRIHSGLENMVRDSVMKTDIADDERNWKRASPHHRIGETDPSTIPPTIFVHGSGDSLAFDRESLLIFEKMKRAGDYQVGMCHLDKAQHAFELVNSLRTQMFVNGVEKFCRVLHARYLAENGGNATLIDNNSSTDGDDVDTENAATES